MSKGVSVMQCDTPCPITTGNITSFNLYNTCIDPSGRYHAAIAAQSSAQLSFTGSLNPPRDITGRQRDLRPASFPHPSPLDHPSPRERSPLGGRGHVVLPAYGLLNSQRMTGRNLGRGEGNDHEKVHTYTVEE